jgi:hypothetical protein
LIVKQPSGWSATKGRNRHSHIEVSGLTSTARTHMTPIELGDMVRDALLAIKWCATNEEKTTWLSSLYGGR